MQRPALFVFSDRHVDSSPDLLVNYAADPKQSNSGSTPKKGPRPFCYGQNALCRGTNLNAAKGKADYFLDKPLPRSQLLAALTKYLFLRPPHEQSKLNQSRKAGNTSFNS